MIKNTVNTVPLSMPPNEKAGLKNITVHSHQLCQIKSHVTSGSFQRYKMTTNSKSSELIQNTEAATKLQLKT